MKVSRFFPILVTALALFGALAPQAARSADVLYIGDDGDNTATPPIPSSIKSFAADTGKLLGVSQGPGIMPVLAGPRGLVVDGRALLVVNQNVNLDIPGEVLRYDATTLQFLDRLIPSYNKNGAVNPDAPFAPDGLVLGGVNSVTPCPPSALQMSCDLIVSVVLRKANTGPPGRVARYNGVGTFLSAATIKNNEHHPRGVVFGPDGLYVSTRDFTKGLGGTVLRFSADGKSEVFIDDQGGPGHLNRPDGRVFGPDGRLYVTSFQAAPGDTHSIRIYDAKGAYVTKIDLPNYAQSLLFGPGKSLFVPIYLTGEVRRYDHVLSCPGTGCDASTPFIPAGPDLHNPRYMTFGLTDRSTLKYPPPTQ
jgi:hypothetical protein